MHRQNIAAYVVLHEDMVLQRVGRHTEVTQVPRVCRHRGEVESAWYFHALAHLPGAKVLQLAELKDMRIHLKAWCRA